MQSVPFRLQLNLTSLFLSCFLLTRGSQLFELVLVDLHIRPNNRKSYSVYSLVPVRSLLGLVEPLNYNWIGFSHVWSHQLYNVIRVEQKKRSFSSLVVHTLGGKHQSMQQIYTELSKLWFSLASQKVKNFFNRADVDYFLGRISQGPELDEAF